MKLDLTIAQAIVVAGRSGPGVVARSDDFPPAWEEAAVTAASRFGQRPTGVACPAAVFAIPVGKTHVAVVQVADQPGSDAADPPLGFRFLILGRKLYEALGDPFAIAERFPAAWSTRGTLPGLSWPPEPLPNRTVDELQRVLKGPEKTEATPQDNSLLLGGTQAIVDGGRVAIVRPAPDSEFVRGLWALLPTRTRCEIWPASFAFSPDLGFHAVVLPTAERWPVGYMTEEQARDYPEGRYELALQIAVEAGNQRELDRLLARRSSAETLRLALYMLAAAVVLAIVSKFFL